LLGLDFFPPTEKILWNDFFHMFPKLKSAHLVNVMWLFNWKCIESTNEIENPSQKWACSSDIES
jgi:hypothetical protein